MVIYKGYRLLIKFNCSKRREIFEENEDFTKVEKKRGLPPCSLVQRDIILSLFEPWFV